MSGASAVVFNAGAAGTAPVLARKGARVEAHPHRRGNMAPATAFRSPAASCLSRRPLHCPPHASTAHTLLTPLLSRSAAAVRQPRRGKGLCQAVLTSDYVREASVTSQVESQPWKPLGVLSPVADASAGSDAAAGSSAVKTAPDPSTLLLPDADETTNLIVSALFVVAVIGLVTLTAGVIYLAWADWNDKREVEALQKEAAQESRSKAAQEPRTPRRDPPPGMRAAKGFGSQGPSEQK